MGSSLSDGNLRRESIHVPRKSRSVENSCKQSSFSQTLLFISRVLESRRSSRHFICFQRRCWYGNVCTTQRHVTWPTSVCRRRLRTAVATLALQSPGPSWCPGLGRLLACAVLLRMTPGPGTDYKRPSDHQNCRSLHSSASSRPTRSSTRQCRLQLWVSCTVVRRCCDCTASSAPTPRLDSTRQCSMLCTSGFATDVMFAQTQKLTENGVYAQRLTRGKASGWEVCCLRLSRYFWHFPANFREIPHSVKYFLTH